MNTGRITARDLKGWPSAVKDMVVEAVNSHGVGWRLMDGGHIRLYAGGRGTVPFKASASRPAEDTIRRLDPWLKENVTSWADRNRPAPAARMTAAARPVITVDPPAPSEADLLAAQAVTRIRAAVAVIAEHHGLYVTDDPGDIDALRAENDALRAELDVARAEAAALRRQRDDDAARLAMIREAANA